MILVAILLNNNYEKNDKFKDFPNIHYNNDINSKVEAKIDLLLNLATIIYKVKK